MTIRDDDTRGVTVSAETLPVNEGSTGTYMVVLNSQPTASVTVTPSSDNSDVAVSSALTFTTTNWNMAQPVTVTAAQDSDAVDDAATISHAVMGGDYGAVTAASVAVTVDDDEVPDTTAPTVTSIVRQTPASSPTNANSLTWRVTFSEAVSNVDATDFAVSGTTATLTVAAVSGVTGAYDVTASGGNLAGLSATVTLSFATGQNIQDAANNTLTNTAPTGTNDHTYVLDNTAPTVTITGVPGTSSAPFTATFTFSEAVTGFVVGDITLDNATASNFTVTSTTVYTALITPTANGTVTVDVAVNVAQDAVGNDNTAATQASSTYTAPVITIAAGTSPVTEGTSAAFALSRAGSTTAELTVNATVSETGGDMVAPANEGARTVTFQANSATATLSVPTVADQVDEADGVVTATVTADTATPATYTAGTPSTATVTVSDDDTRGVTVSAETLPVNEGSTGTYTVVLNSQPTASVTVTPSSDNSDVAVSSTLTFTTTNWNTAQTVTVTAAQDSDAVDDAATISHAVMGGDYGAVTAASVAVTVDDDEVPDTTAPRSDLDRASDPREFTDECKQPDLAGDVQRGGVERGCDGFRGERNDRHADCGRGLRGDGRVRCHRERRQPGRSQRHGHAVLCHGPEHPGRGEQHAHQYSPHGHERPHLRPGQYRPDGDDHRCAGHQQCALHGDVHLLGGGHGVCGGRYHARQCHGLELHGHEHDGLYGADHADGRWYGDGGRGGQCGAGCRRQRQHGCHPGQLHLYRARAGDHD